MGRQLNANVLYVINEVELSIYRFLTSGANKNKKQPSSTGSLVVRAFNVLAGYRCFDRMSTGKEGTSTKKGRLLEERECF